MRSVAVDLLQTWIVLGVPMLTVAAGLFVGRSRARALLGYAVLLGLVAILALTPGGGLSAAVVGAIAVVFVATGRGTHIDEEHLEHHEMRSRYTRADGAH